MIRSAEAADADEVFALLQQLSVSFAPDARAFSRNFPYLVEDGATVILVAVGERGVAGYALASLSTLLYTNGPSAQLHELVVDETERSIGLGTQLLEAVEVECRTRGAKQLTVACRRASAFYSDRGFAVTADFLKKPL
jgi:N-acetylglutamate synthase-like GNAT family acetyltransferase